MKMSDLEAQQLGDPDYFGKVQVVQHKADFKVQIVESFEDLRIEIVDHLFNSVGKWKFVDHDSNLRIKFVTHQPDIKVRIINSRNVNFQDGKRGL
jgi:hypothetical protein